MEIRYEEDGSFVRPSVDMPLIPVPELSKKAGMIVGDYLNHPSRGVPVVGVTGTNGKSSCAIYIAQCLNALHKPCAVMGTLGNGMWPNLEKTSNTTLSAPRLQYSLRRMIDQGATAVAMEVSSHALAEYNVNGVAFDTAVFTNLTQDHLDYHGSMEAYGEMKARLFMMPGLSRAVINLDDDFGQHLFNRFHAQLACVGFTLNPVLSDASSVVCASHIVCEGRKKTVSVITPWGDGLFTTELAGNFNISNCLAVLAVLGGMGVSVDQACDLLSHLTAAPGRLQCYGGGDQPLVIVDYAHTPDALEKALEAVHEFWQGDVSCVFGCGGERDVTKRPLMAAIAERLANQVVLTDDNPRHEDAAGIVADMKAGMRYPDNAWVEHDRAAAILNAIKTATENTCVLVAGKGHETTQIIGDDEIPLDDRLLVEKGLERWQPTQ